MDLAVKAVVTRMAQLSLESDQPQQGKRKAATNQIPRPSASPMGKEQALPQPTAPEHEEMSLRTERDG